jgi:4-amino-4-deoxy-L-arabinose transferase-like glycosyltransferase
VVAGSQSGSEHALGDDRVLPFSSRRVPAWFRARALQWQCAGDWPALIVLYLLAAAAMLLPWPFGTHPAWAYNWEGYTAWRWETYWEAPAGPAIEIWAPTDGLMTDSGQGPLVGLPVAIGTAVAGFEVSAMRLPVSILAAVSVPVLWLLGRRLFGAGPATLAALLLATSPVFLLYGRTATLVGVSLLPLLLSALALMRVLDAGDNDGWHWRREGLLAASLVLGIYAYAPVRLLWPLAVGLLALAAVCNSARRSVLMRAALLCALIVPAALMFLAQVTRPDPDPLGAMIGYFHARGEQLVAMDDLADAGQYLRVEDVTAGSGWDAATRLVRQNAVDLARLLLDHDTGPPPVEFWNERGRFWPWFLLPFAAIGAISTVERWVRESRRHTSALAPFALFLGLALPLLLTSRVHIGRLLPALPFALLLVAAGAWLAAGWISVMVRRVERGDLNAERWIAPVIAGTLLVPAAVGARFDMATPLSPTRESLTAMTLADWHEDAGERGGAVLVEDPALGDDIERVHAATYRLDLDRIYRFVDIQQSGGMLDVDEAAPDSRPALLWRGAMEALQSGEIAHSCKRLWFVTPEIAGDFFTAWQKAGCADAPDSVILP